MADNSAIEWTEATWNPMAGCEEVSPGCAHCYAETFASVGVASRGIPTSRASRSSSGHSGWSNR